MSYSWFPKTLRLDQEVYQGEYEYSSQDDDAQQQQQQHDDDDDEEASRKESMLQHLAQSLQLEEEEEEEEEERDSHAVVLAETLLLDAPQEDVRAHPSPFFSGSSSSSSYMAGPFRQKHSRQVQQALNNNNNNNSEEQALAASSDVESSFSVDSRDYEYLYRPSSDNEDNVFGRNRNSRGIISSSRLRSRGSILEDEAYNLHLRQLANGLLLRREEEEEVSLEKVEEPTNLDLELDLDLTADMTDFSVTQEDEIPIISTPAATMNDPLRNGISPPPSPPYPHHPDSRSTTRLDGFGLREALQPPTNDDNSACTTDESYRSKSKSKSTTSLDIKRRMEADHDNHNSNIHINRWDDEEDSTGVEGYNMNNNSMMEKLISSFRGNLSPEVLTFLDAKDVDENDVDEGKRQCLGEQWKEEAQSSLPNYLCPAMMDAKNHAKREEQDHNKKEKWKKETTPQTPHKSRRSKLFLWVGIAFASLTITAVVSVTLVLLKSKSNQNGGSLEDRHTCGGVSVSELKQGRVVMIINETSLENVQTQQRALEETYRMAYNDATGMWSGIDVFERILQSATIDSVEVIRANITRLSWSAVVNCSGCFGYEPLFATETNNSDGKERRDLQLLHQGATGNSIMMRFYEEFNAHLHDTLDDSSPNSKLFYIAAITDTGEPDQYVGMELETPWLELSSPAPSISASTSSNPTSMSTAAIMVLSWVLVNADNDEDIREIFNGDELDLASLPKNLNIRADVTPLTKEVYFYKYDELVEHENKPPYAFASNDARNLSSYKPSSTLKC